MSGKSSKTGLQLRNKKSENFAEWYSEVITAAEMIDYYDISGCYILRPWAFSIWEQIQGWFDSEIKSLGVKNSYFPVFVSRSSLEREEDHVEGFAPEVAWVTKSGDTDLKEPIAIRPTSETIMYPAYAKWIQSHRDLPLRLNQWTNVVRWEFKHPTPFIRTREFLWQEGHSAFATKREADDEVLTILDLYARVYEELLAVPVIKGRKSEKEKFAGGLYTTTVEAYVPSTGRAIQGGTSHCLGQNFAKMFGISFENESGSSSLVWQNSWGLTTRTIGVMVMVHGDDTGLILPPRVAPVQAIIIFIQKVSTPEDQIQRLKDTCNDIAKRLQASGVRAEVDDRSNYTAGWKYNHWEQKGVPLRIEIGPADLEKDQVVFARRDVLGREGKSFVANDDQLCDKVQSMLGAIQLDMLERARRDRDKNVAVADTWDDFTAALNKGHMVLSPWCEHVECEEDVKERTGPKAQEAEAGAAGEEAGRGLTGAAKSLCLPFSGADVTGQRCFACGKEASAMCLWGRSY